MPETLMPSPKSRKAYLAKALLGVTRRNRYPQGLDLLYAMGLVWAVLLLLLNLFYFSPLALSPWMNQLRVIALWLASNFLLAYDFFPSYLLRRRALAQASLIFPLQRLWRQKPLQTWWHLLGVKLLAYGGLWLWAAFQLLLSAQSSFLALLLAIPLLIRLLSFVQNEKILLGLKVFSLFFVILILPKDPGGESPFLNLLGLNMAKSVEFLSESSLLTLGKASLLLGLPLGLTGLMMLAQAPLLPRKFLGRRGRFAQFMFHGVSVFHILLSILPGLLLGLLNQSLVLGLLGSTGFWLTWIMMKQADLLRYAETLQDGGKVPMVPGLIIWGLGAFLATVSGLLTCFGLGFLITP
jgi:hypothetical protein